ncbi:MAG TPA: NfeD family protein [Clostridia bacterium]|nr:NfeD family protein [Clostridia bacterium]
MDYLMQYIMGWSVPALICLILGLLLLVYEMFVPGMGVPGILGFILLIAAVVLRADSFASGAITLAIILVLLGGAGFFIFRSLKKGVLSRSPLILKESIEEKSTPLSNDDMQSLVGLEGVALTALRPSGNAMIGEKRLDVVTEGEFVAKGAKIVVIRVEGLRVLVKPVAP